LHSQIGEGNILTGTGLSKNRPNRDFRAPARTDKEKDRAMKKFGFATIAASGLAAAFLGLAAPAQAEIGHHDWIHDIQPQVTVPQVDTNVHHSR